MAQFAQDTRDLDLAALAALLEVIDTGSFTAAARALGISQPAVSLSIKRLEERLGTALVVRARKHIVATRPGELLAAGARRSFEALNNAVALMSDEQAEPTGRVILGCHESLAAYALPPFMARFLHAYPKVELRLWNGTSMQVERELVDGRVDIGLVVNPSQHPDTVVTWLFDDFVELFHCLPTGHNDPISLLQTVPLIYVPELVQSQDILRRLYKSKATIARLLPCSSLELAKSLVLDRVGLGILPRRVAEHGTRKRVRSLSPPLPKYRDRIALVRRYDLAQTAALRVAIDELQAHGRDMKDG